MLFWVWVTEKIGASELYGSIKRMRKMKISAEKAFATVLTMEMYSIP